MGEPLTAPPGTRRVLWVVGVTAALVAAGGWAGERWRLGPDDDAFFDRIQRHVETELTAASDTLDAVGRDVARAVPEAVPSPSGSTAALFELARAALVDLPGQDPALTIHDADGIPLAWAGRPSEVRVPRNPVAPSLQVTVADRALRLVHIAPVAVIEDELGRLRSQGAVVAEHVLARPTPVPLSPETFTLPTPFVDVTLRSPDGPTDTPHQLTLTDDRGQPLLRAEVASDDLLGARRRWRRGVWALLLVVPAVGLLVGVAPLTSRPPRGVTPGALRRRTLLAVVGIGGAASLIWGTVRLLPATTAALDPAVYRSQAIPGLLGRPADVLVLGLTLVALALVLVFAVEQLRLGRTTPRPAPATPWARHRLLAQLAAGALVAGLLVALDAFMADAFEGAAIDLLNTSLEPWDAGRLTLLAGVLLVMVAGVWVSVVALVTGVPPRSPRPRGTAATVVAVACWLLPAGALTTAGLLPALPTLVMITGVVGGAVVMPLVRPRVRHASYATRTLVLVTSFLTPVLLTYPLLLHHGDAATRRTIETDYAPEVAQHAETLQVALSTTLTEIDALLDVDPGADLETDSDPAFDIWRQTELARRRLTSAVELYRADGSLRSRFALNYPEYTSLPFERVVVDCDWEVFGEIAPFGSDERRVLHAERALCDETPGRAPRRTGSVVIHVAWDYRTLSFIPSDSPYPELLATTGVGTTAASVRERTEVAIYGWGRQPLFVSGREAWSIDDALFGRIYATRDPFWTRLTKGGRSYATHVANNRVGIYVVGYPVFGPFEHLVHLAELATLAGLLVVALGLLASAIAGVTPGRSRFGRALLREVRTSFYRRLFLAFVAATLIPVLALAFGIRTYFANQLRAEVEAGAARTAAVAQRVIEESQDPTALVNDDLMVWMSQVLDQEINIYQGARLAATSDRDLFASGLLPTRTPDEVYTAILLERRSTHVMPDPTGTRASLVAATPIPSVGPDAILTVPLASQQREIERQIEDLDRGILLGVVLFVLLGAGGGLYLAERIADPVNRLTHATRQIARGDLDAQIAARSADELEQLVGAFNRMAADLKAQRQQLEKTNRLEAWAEMARQVAHEIKNPLTPVQLSAEHLLRVHADRGEPLSPVLESCVDSILTQVRLLRQIAAEFSSYASSPTVRREPTAVDALVRSVVDPYLVGLEDRIQVQIDVPATLPRLELDRTLVSRALTNVIENALHAMPAEGRLEIAGTFDDEDVLLQVTDTGVGLDPDTLARIFEPYFSTRVTGTGLGMAIAKRNVELNDGRIDVTSRKDHGTTVRLRFRRPDPVRT